MHRSLTLCLFLTLGVSLGLTAVLLAPELVPEPEHAQSIEWLNTPRTLSSFDLRTPSDSLGIRALNKRSLEGHWSIVVFGYTRCPDVCPTSLAELAILAERLNPSEVDIEYLFVSVDPQRDSVAVVDQYARYFHSKIRGLTGSSEQLERLTDALRIRVKVDPNSDEYSVAHSSTFSIIGPDANLRGRFRPGFNAEEVTRSFTSFLQQERNRSATRHSGQKVQS